jgi:hypothetical protein
MKRISHPSSFILHPSMSRGGRLMLLTFRLIAHFNHLTAAVTPTAFADVMRAHQLAALQTGHQRWRVEALMLAPVAATVARNFCLWYGTHWCIL